MTNQLQLSESAVATGIKESGIGKKGSKDLSPKLIQNIINEFKCGQVPDVQAGAFWGGLLMKGLTHDELQLEDILEKNMLRDPLRFVEYLAPRAPTSIKKIMVRLLQKETLNNLEAFHLGQFLLSEEHGNALRGLAASILRVRYETEDEYAGLLQSMEETFLPVWRTETISNKENIIQIAEPFDGVDHSYIITPAVVTKLQQHFNETKFIHLVGRNSGPKNFFNLHDILEKIKTPFLIKPEDIQRGASEHGWGLRQRDLSPALDRWVESRRLIIKRPFFATLERFLNPLQAEIVIASAFHPPYGEKMLRICERAGYKGGIIVRNGLEGSTAFPLLRPVKILCTARQSDGTYQRNEFELDPAEFTPGTILIEEKLENPLVTENIRLLQLHLRTGQSGNIHFDTRVKFTTTGLIQAINWVRQNIQ